MELIGKTVKHAAYGPGNVSAFYKSSRKIWISFPNSQPKPYNVPEDFDSGLISTEDEDILRAIQEIKDSAVYKYSWYNTKKIKTKNKNLKEVIDNCCAILDELGIKRGKISEWDAIKSSIWGQCSASMLIPGTFIIFINEVLLRDNTTDGYLYDTVLHELFHTVDDCIGHGHGRAFHNHAKTIERRCGYSVTAKASYDRFVSWEHEDLTNRLY